jgi:hypothetical protein
MKTKSILTVLAVAAGASLLLSGCVAAIGNSGYGKGNATLGQQMIDLQKARDCGAITPDEYAAQKKKLLGEK